MQLKISNIANLPSKWGEFKIQAFKEGFKEHLCIFKGEIKDGLAVRIHSECLTGDALGSLKCDCGPQLEYALKFINEHGGMVIYLRQEGRNIGLFNKVNAYALQDEGLNTIEANLKLGFKADEREYSVVEAILRHYALKKIRLLTNNPVKLSVLSDTEVLERLPVIIKANAHNENYLKVKQEQMGHMLEG